MPLGGGGGIGGGGYSGGPAIIPVSELMVQSMAEDQLIKDLIAQDIAFLGTGAIPTAADIISGFDGNLSGGGLPAIDLNSLFSSSSLDTLNSLYEQAAAGQTQGMDEYFDYMNNVSSMDWAAWHSGPSSDILNFIAFQQQVLQISFQEFSAQRFEANFGQQQTGKSQQESIAISYLVDRAGSMVNANPGMTFREALDHVAASVAANSSDLIAYAQALTGNIETVVVTAPYNYGASTIPDISWVTADGQRGVGSGIFDDLSHLPSEFGAIVDVLHQHGVSFNALAHAAHDMSFAEWLNHVQSKGEWDVKYAGQAQGIFINQMHSWFVAAGISQTTMSDFGNFLLGFVAAARDYSLPYTLEGAGAYQVFVQGLGDHSAQAGAAAVASTAAGGLLVGAENVIHDWLAAADEFASGHTDGLSTAVVPLANDVAQWLTANGFSWGDNPGDSSQITEGWLFYHG